jgi:hypothetical protein
MTNRWTILQGSDGDALQPRSQTKTGLCTEAETFAVCCSCCSFSPAVTKPWINHLHVVCSRHSYCAHLSSGHHHPKPFLLQTQLSAKTRTKRLEQFLKLCKIQPVSQDTAVCTVTHYRLDSPGTELQRRMRDLPHPSRLALHPTQYKWYQSSFSGVHQLRHYVDHPPHLVLRLKEE